MSRIILIAIVLATQCALATAGETLIELKEKRLEVLTHYRDAVFARHRAGKATEREVIESERRLSEAIVAADAANDPAKVEAITLDLEIKTKAYLKSTLERKRDGKTDDSEVLFARYVDKRAEIDHMILHTTSASAMQIKYDRLKRQAEEMRAESYDLARAELRTGKMTFRRVAKLLRDKHQGEYEVAALPSLQELQEDPLNLVSHDWREMAFSDLRVRQMAEWRRLETDVRIAIESNHATRFDELLVLGYRLDVERVFRLGLLDDTLEVLHQFQTVVAMLDSQWEAQYTSGKVSMKEWLDWHEDVIEFAAEDRSFFDSFDALTTDAESRVARSKVITKLAEDRRKSGDEATSEQALLAKAHELAVEIATYQELKR